MSFESIKHEVLKTETLDELFKLWKKAHIEEDDTDNDSKTYIYYETHRRKKIFPPIEKDSFIYDGYISEEDYKNAQKKILFIFKETTLVMHRKDENCKPNERDQSELYYRYINNLKSNQTKQQEKMARIAFYLQNPDLSEECRRNPDDEALKKALKSSGYMNVNKRGGGAFLDNCIFENYYDMYEDFVEKQIEIMKPDYIVIIGENDFYFNKAIEVWHTSYPIKGKKRTGTEYGSDPDVDCYMREFFNTINVNLNNTFTVIRAIEYKSHIISFEAFKYLNGSPNMSNRTYWAEAKVKNCNSENISESSEKDEDHIIGIKEALEGLICFCGDDKLVLPYFRGTKSIIDRECKKCEIDPLHNEFVDLKELFTRITGKDLNIVTVCELIGIPRDRFWELIYYNHLALYGRAYIKLLRENHNEK